MCCTWFAHHRALATWAYVLETVCGAVRRLSKISNCAFKCDYYNHYYIAPTRSCWFSPLWMWLRGANSWAHSSDLPTPGDSTPTVLARRHWSGHQALGASCRTTADGGLPSSHRPEDLAQSSHRTQKKRDYVAPRGCSFGGPPRWPSG